MASAVGAFLSSGASRVCPSDGSLLPSELLVEKSMEGVEKNIRVVREMCRVLDIESQCASSVPSYQILNAAMAKLQLILAKCSKEEK